MILLMVLSLRLKQGANFEFVNDENDI